MERKASSGNGANKRTESNGLRDLFLMELKDIYWAEKALVKALPKMAKKATAPELIEAIEGHLEETQTHVIRVEEAFELLGEKAKAEKCEAMDGLLKEAEELMSETEDGVVRDAAIIAAAQKVEHYEMASYGTMIAFASTLGEDKVATLLSKTLEQEKAADEKLSMIAESCINLEAAEEEGEE